MSSKLYCWPDIYRFGLGNKLMVWVRSEVFAHDHNAEMLAPRFVQLPSATALFGGVGARGYRTNLGNFDLTRGGYVSGFRRAWILNTRQIVDEQLWMQDFDDGVVRFAGADNDRSIRMLLSHHDYIYSRLRMITNKGILDFVNKISSEPFIGVHVRRGDFKINGLAISDAWYVRAIGCALDQSGLSLVRVFSDGLASELSFVAKAFPRCRVVIMPAAKPLSDIWALSESKVMVGSSGSTFSALSVALGQMPSIWHPVNAPRGGDLYVDPKKIPLVVE